MRVVKVEWRITSNSAPRQIEGTIDGWFLFTHYRRQRLRIEITQSQEVIRPDRFDAVFEITTVCRLTNNEIKPIVRDALRLWAFSFYGERCKLEIRTHKRGAKP